MPRIHVLHENDDWAAPLFAALDGTWLVQQYVRPSEPTITCAYQ